MGAFLYTGGMDIKDFLADCEQNEEFGLFQEVVFRILQNRGHFLNDIILEDLSEEVRNLVYEATHEMWSEIVHFNKVKRVGKKILQLDKDTGRLIAVYHSAVQAAKAVGGKPVPIRAVCRGLRNSSSGYNWRYERTEFERG